MDYRGVSKRKFRFSKLKKYDKEAFCNIIYEHDQLIVDSPIVKASTKVIRNKNKTYIVVELNQDSKDFFDFLKMVDHMCVNVTARNSENWFQGKRVTKAIIKDAYQSPCIEDNPMLARFLLGSVNRIYNHRGERIPSTNIEVGSKLKFVLQLSGLWVTGNFIGVHWQIEEIQMLAKEKSPSRSRKSKLKTSRRESDEDEEYMRFRRKYAEQFASVGGRNESSEEESDEQDNDDHENYNDDPEGIYESENSENSENSESENSENAEEEYKKYKRKLDEARKYISKYKGDEDSDSVERRRSFETDSEQEELEILTKPPRRGGKTKKPSRNGAGTRPVNGDDYEPYTEELEMGVDFSKLNYGKKRKIREEHPTLTHASEEGLEINETNEEIKKVNF